MKTYFLVDLHSQEGSNILSKFQPEKQKLLNPESRQDRARGEFGMRNNKDLEIFTFAPSYFASVFTDQDVPIDNKKLYQRCLSLTTRTYSIVVTQHNETSQ